MDVAIIGLAKIGVFIALSLNVFIEIKRFERNDYFSFIKLLIAVGVLIFVGLSIFLK